MKYPTLCVTPWPRRVVPRAGVATLASGAARSADGTGLTCEEGGLGRSAARFTAKMPKPPRRISLARIDGLACAGM